MHQKPTAVLTSHSPGGKPTGDHRFFGVADVTANGSPAASFDPADFLMPDEVFQFIAELEAWGVRLAEVSCDEQWHFPGTVVSLRSAGTAMTYYRISGFRELAGGSELPVARAATGPAAGAP